MIPLSLSTSTQRCKNCPWLCLMLLPTIHQIFWQQILHNEPQHSYETLESDSESHTANVLCGGALFIWFNAEIATTTVGCMRHFSPRINSFSRRNWLGRPHRTSHRLSAGDKVRRHCPSPSTAPSLSPNYAKAEGSLFT